MRVCAPVGRHVLFVCTVHMCVAWCVCVCVCVLWVCVHLLADTCCVCARCRCIALMCAAWECVCVVMGHGLGAWGPRWAGGCRWELPAGALLGWRLCPTSARVLRLNAARRPVCINHGTKSLDQEPRRCQAHPLAPPLRGSSTWAHSLPNWPAGWTDRLSSCTLQDCPA